MWKPVPSLQQATHDLLDVHRSDVYRKHRPLDPEAPLVSFFARVATSSLKFLMPIISLLCLVGIYAFAFFFDVWVMIISGIVGFIILSGNTLCSSRHRADPGSDDGNNLRKSLMMSMVVCLPFSAAPITYAFLLVTVASSSIVVN